MSEDDVAALAVGCAAVEVQTAVLNVPFAGNMVFAIAAPAVETGAVEEDIVAVLVNLQRAEVNLWVLYNYVLRLCLYARSNGKGCCCEDIPEFPCLVCLDIDKGIVHSP